MRIGKHEVAPAAAVLLMVIFPAIAIWGITGDWGVFTRPVFRLFSLRSPIAASIAAFVLFVAAFSAYWNWRLRRRLEKLKQESGDVTPTPLHHEVFALVGRCCGLPPELLSPGVTIRDDLGVDGDDADELFAEFGEKFKVDLSELGRDWSSYFAPEGIGGALGGPSKNITLEQMVDAARCGRWPAS